MTTATNKTALLIFSDVGGGDEALGLASLRALVDDYTILSFGR